MATRQLKPVQFVIRNFGKTRVFSYEGVNWNITRDQVLITEDEGFAKFMNAQYMVQVKKKNSGLPI